MGHARGIAVDHWPELSALVDRVVDARAATARAQAAESGLLADAVELVLSQTSEMRAKGDLPLREVAAELGAAVRVGDRTIQRRMGDAFALRDGFAATARAWENGEIDADHVSAVLSAGSMLDDEHRRRYEALVLEAARQESAGRLQGIARSIVAQVDPDGADRRIRAAENDRQVRLYDTGDGMSRILADLPAVLAHAIHDRLTQQARAVRDAAAREESPGGHDHTTAAVQTDADDATHTTQPTSATTDDDSRDTRTLDQLRADILCDTLLAGAPVAHGEGLGAIVAHVQVTISATALAGDDDEPAVLAGSGPVCVGFARRLAGAASAWDRVFTDPASGAVFAVDRYRPSAELKRLLRARDEHCRFPGCRRAAVRCDIDHTHDAALGGETCAGNLCHLCRRHHVLKHETAWSVRQLPGGVIEWRSPTGRFHRDRPPSTVRFVPAADPPPF